MAEKMDTEENPEQRANKGSASGLSISLHPLVIINISDHTTRKKVQNQGQQQRVLGVLLGTQEGRAVELCNSFELDYKIVDGKLQIDMQYLQVKQEQYKKVFAKYEPVGWYSNSTMRLTPGEVQPGDIDIHREIAGIIENPLYLLLDTSDGAGIRDLPVSLFESEVHIIDETPTLTFARSQYHLETEEAERVSVDQVSHLLPTGATSASSAMSSHISSVHSAVKMLQKRIQAILALLREMQAGKVPKDHKLLRMVASLCHRLPAMQTQDFKDEFLEVYNDTLLVTYLAAMTKGTNSANELIDKYNVAFERQSRRRGLF